MRQKPKLQDRKLKKVLKSRVSVLGRANIDTAKRKRTKITSSRLATCHSKLKGQDIKPQRRQKRIRDRTVSTAKGMAELHLPFLSSAQRYSLSNAEILDKLGWSTVQVPFVKDDIWANARLSPEQEKKICSEINGANWSAPPSARPDRAIRAYVDHLHSVWGCKPRLQIPAHWPVFSTVDWEQDPLFTAGSTNSSDTLAHKRNRHSVPCERKTTKDLKLPHETAIHCHLRSIQQPRVRMQWQLMQSMQPSWFKWRYQTEARAKRRHARRHAGFMDYNQTSPNQDLWPQASVSDFLRPLRERIVPWSTPVDWLSEAHTLNDVGRVITNLVATDAFPPQSQENLNWPLCLSLGTQSPIIDYSCRARNVSFGGHQRFQPLLFAAQRQGDHPKDAVQRLALAFQPMMTLFILYFLETRKNCDEPMPHWMVLFGVVYGHDGFYLQAFYPSFKPQNYKGSHGENDWGWGATSAGLSYDHISVMTQYSWSRSSSVELLYRIQGHCSHVLERLREWNGYERVCKHLLIEE